MNPNDFAKLAYEQGVQDALRDAGLTKEALGRRVVDGVRRLFGRTHQAPVQTWGQSAAAASLKFPTERSLTLADVTRKRAGKPVVGVNFETTRQYGVPHITNQHLPLPQGIPAGSGRI